MVSKAQPGSIALFHNAAKNTPEALPGVIEGLLREGFELVPISELLLPGECGVDYTMAHTGRQCRMNGQYRRSASPRERPTLLWGER